MNQSKRIAIFFDCENVNVKYLQEIYDQLANDGQVIMSRAYADWNNSRHNRWREALSEFAIEQIQPNSSGKNSSDMKIVIDVMKTIYEKKVDIIVLVSSDSDFSSLAIEIKSQVLIAIGFGEEKSSKALRKAFTTFVELPLGKRDIKTDELLKILKDAVEHQKDESGYALIAQVGSYLARKDASLISKNYGFDRWGNAFKKYSQYFDIDYKDERKSVIMVKIKEEV